MYQLRLRAIRQNAGISQGELAEKIQVNQTAVSQWERGAAYPSCDKLPLLADLLHCTIDDLFGREAAS